MKTEKFKSAAAIALAVMICATSLTACGSGGQKPKTGKDTPKQTQQVTPKKSDKKSSKDDKKSPSVKGTSDKKDDAAKLPAVSPGKNDAPAAKLPAPNAPGKTPAANQGNQNSSVKGTEKKDKGSASKGTGKKDSAAKKADQKKPAVKAPSADKNAPAAGKTPTVKSGK